MTNTITIASGYNPLKLTNAEVDTEHGWRLLNLDEMQLTSREEQAAQICTDIEWYNEVERTWDDRGWKACRIDTYRTQLSRYDLEAARFDERNPFSQCKDKIKELDAMVISFKAKLEELSKAIAKFDK